MTDTDVDTDTDTHTETELPENMLFGLYERYIGEPGSQTEVYLGFGVFFAGITCAVLGLVLFLGGTLVYGLRQPGYVSLAQPGYILGMASVPVALFGIVLLLPVKRRMTVAALSGIGIIAVAIVAFVLSYPYQWFEFGTQNTLLVVGTYAVGLSIVTAATGSALVGHRVEQARIPGASEGVPEKGTQSDGDDRLTEEDVQSDIDEAMSDVEYTWGGVEKQEHRSLKFTDDYADESSGEIDVDAERTVDPHGTDDQVKGLKQLRGGETSVETSNSDVNDQTSALTELRNQQQSESSDDDDEQSDGLLARVRSWLFG